MFGYYFDLALRSLKRSPVLTVLMVLAIAVGIGASMTTLTVMSLLSGDPLPNKSGKLFFPQVDPETGANVRKSPPDEMDYTSARDLWLSRRADRQAMLIDGKIKVQPTDAQQAPFMTTMLGTTSDFFAMFDVPFRYGGVWSASDEAGAAHQVVISETLNQRLFNGANSVGREVVMNGNALRVVGVLAHWRPSPRFYMVVGAHNSGGDTADLYGPPHDAYLPMPTAIAVDAGNINWYTCWSTGAHIDPKDLRHAPCLWVALWVELDSPAKAASYRHYLDSYDAQQRSFGRFTHKPNTRFMSLHQWLDYQGVVPGDVKLQTGFAFCFLAVCLFNTVGLLLAKFLRRAPEIGVRRALGASRGAIFAQFLIEAGCIGLLGGLFGLLLASGGVWLVRQQPVAYADLVQLNVPMFLITFALAIASSLAAGAFPALRASRVPPALQLKAP